MDDTALLQEFARNNSDTAFATLVERYIGLVFSAALRQLRDPHLAEDVTQAVFMVLARKAGQLSRQTVLSGWLLKATRYAASVQIRAAVRRSQREQEACMQSTLNETSPETWEQLAPLLDEAMASLSDADRNVLALRFFENKTAQETGRTLKLNEATVHKRTSRSIGKLRKFFARRGVVSTAAIIAGTISANSVQAAPAGLAQSVTVAAVAKGTAASTSTLTLIKGALKIMAWTKVKTAIVTGVVVLLAAGTTTVVAHRVYDHIMYSWEIPNPTLKDLAEARAQLTILPAKYPHSTGAWVASNGGRAIGISCGVRDMLELAYTTSARMIDGVSPGDLPPDFYTKRYDFINSFPGQAQKAMQEAIQKKFGLIGQYETIETNVLILRMKNPHPADLKPDLSGPRSYNPQDSSFSCSSLPIANLTYFLELYLAVPVVDQTGLTGRYDMKMNWKEPDPANSNGDGLKQALQDQLGLELVSGTAPIKMLVIKKAN
jgi:uncharacterized protein (TIGR03435 family)